MMIVVSILAIALVVAFLVFAIVMRRRDAAERKEWRAFIKEQTLINDAALVERRKSQAKAGPADLRKPNDAE